MSERPNPPLSHLPAGQLVSEQCITLRQLADECGCEITLVEDFIQYGIVEPVIHATETPVFPEWAANRVGRAIRLQKDFDLTLEGLGLVLDLLDRIEALEESLRGKSRG